MKKELKKLTALSAALVLAASGSMLNVFAEETATEETPAEEPAAEEPAAEAEA